MFWSYVYRGYSWLLLFQNGARRGFVLDLGGVLKRVFGGRFSLYFWASAVENVVYFACFGVIGEHGLFGGGPKRQFRVSFVFGGPGTFSLFDVSSRNHYFYRGFVKRPAFLRKPPPVGPLFL